MMNANEHWLYLENEEIESCMNGFDIRADLTGLMWVAA